MKEYQVGSSGGQISGGQADTFEDSDLDGDFDENEYRDPATRHTDEDYVGIPWTENMQAQGVNVVTPSAVPSHVKAHWNRKHITEDYDYRDKKRKKVIKAYIDNPQTIKRNNESAKQEAYELYLEIADRMTDKHGKDVPKSCWKDFSASQRVIPTGL